MNQSSFWNEVGKPKYTHAKIKILDLIKHIVWPWASDTICKYYPKLHYDINPAVLTVSTICSYYFSHTDITLSNGCNAFYSIPVVFFLNIRMQEEWGVKKTLQ